MPNPASAKGPKAMLLDEAKLMGAWIRGVLLTAGSVCLNIGSSTRDFREHVQRHNHSEASLPIELAGARVVLKRPAAHQLAWLFKNYQVTMILVQKPAVSPDGGAA